MNNIEISVGDSVLLARNPCRLFLEVNYSLLKRSSFQTNLSGQLFFFDASLSTAG